MPVLPPSNPLQKKVTWLELFFDLIFALALAMSAKPLEHVTDFSGASWLAIGEFTLLFIFLMMFWYRHMVLVNRFEHSSFLFTLLTLLIGFFVIAFTQFIRIWKIDAVLGGFLATITLFLLMLSLAGLYFISSLRIGTGGEAAGEKTWARAHAKHMLFEAAAYLLGILFVPWMRPYWFIIVWLYFNRYPFETWLNPKKQSTLDPALINVPPIKAPHMAERIGLFALLVYGLVMVLAATPILNLETINSVEGVLSPIVNFGTVFFFIMIIWYLHYRMVEIAQPKTNQFTVMTFVILGLLVATTHFIRIMLEFPSDFVGTMFAIFSGLMISVIAVSYWNVKTMAGVPPTDQLQVAFRQWAMILYAAAGGFFASTLFQTPVREIIWKVITLIIFLVLLFDRRLTLYYSKSMDAKKFKKFLDNQTVTGITLVVLGIIVFFVVTAMMQKSIASWWLVAWIVPLFVGIVVLLNHWLHTRIRPN